MIARELAALARVQAALRALRAAPSPRHGLIDTLRGTRSLHRYRLRALREMCPAA